MPVLPELEPHLAHLARALSAHQDAEAALAAAARRIAGGSATAGALRSMARAEVLERRARLHVTLARQALAGARAASLDDQRRVPAAFRRRRETGPPAVEVLGAPLDRAAARPRDRAAS